MFKLADHAHDRGEERLNLSSDSVDSLQRAIDKMWYSHGRYKLKDNNYYSKINDPRKNLLGYAAMKRVGNVGRSRLILASILNKDMQPRGTNISHFLDTKIKDNQVKLKIPSMFKGFDLVPNSANKKLTK